MVFTALNDRISRDYAMKKSKKSSEQPRDRLSELPDSIIFQIFWLLRMREVVRTTILSKRWKNLWTTIPYLNFDDPRRYDDSKFVNRALILWRGFKILKFKFSFPYYLNESLHSDVDLWVRLAKENGIEELYLYYTNRIIDVNYEELYCLPQNLYLCSSLKVLWLKGCNLQIHGNVQWNQLRSLTIEGYFLDEDLINQVVSCSPRLEVFILNLLDSDENLSIRSSSLKRLSIEKCLRSWKDEPSTDTELRIWSPNLETFEILGVPYSNCLLMNVSSLTDLTLDFYGPRRYHHRLFHGNDFLGEILGKIFPIIQHVEKVTLSDWCIKVLGAMKEKYLLSPLSSFKFLTINKSVVEYEQIAGLLEIFPELKTIVLQPENHFYTRIRANHATSFEQVERNLPKSFLQQLRRVEVTWVDEDDKSIFPFVEILLKYASKLQKMASLTGGEYSEKDDRLEEFAGEKASFLGFEEANSKIGA
ncbi:hypothetical protein C2S51_025251 [Perilla frutescens var. frutescens]|nr:hypothetical protein C2S51_025251 [Perilla frutescens var. frutescens]